MMEILYEDNKMLVCRKPAGVLAQSGKSFDVDMVSQLMTYRRQKGEDTYVGVINRLDRPVDGIMVFAKDSKEAARLNKLLQQNTFNKNYYALVTGKLVETSGRLENYLLKDGKTNTSAIVSKETTGAKKAELEYEVVEITDQYTRVRIHLITGRHHQIRVQFAGIGCPLVGDTKYGGDNIARLEGRDNSRNIALCAYSLDIGEKHFEIEPQF